jgi:hypothetical protein
MPALMRAADVMVENAGGLTTMEAFAARLAVVSYRPIAGHGRDNAHAMAACGVTQYPANDAALGRALLEATSRGAARDAQIAAAQSLFGTDPADEVVRIAADPPPMPVVPLYHTVARRAAGVAAIVALVFGGLTEGAEALAWRGVGVARAPRGQHAVYLGVRADAAALSDADLRRTIATTHATLVVDDRTAGETGHLLRAASASGTDVANGGATHHGVAPWSRASADCSHARAALARATGLEPRDFVSTDAPDAFHQAACRVGRHHERIVVPTAHFGPRSVPRSLDRGLVYELDARGARPGAVARALARFDHDAAVRSLAVHPYRLLR